MKIKLSVVIPAYNEEHNIKRGVLKEVHDYLKKQSYSWEVLVVDDGSTDSTVELAQKATRKYKNFRILEEPHRGKAGTVISGVLAAKGENVLFTDMDQSTPLREIEKFLPYLEQGEDVVIGSRQGRRGAPLTRRVMAFGFAMLRTVILRLPYQDTQAGFKAFRREAAGKLFRKMSKLNHGRVAKGASVTAGFDVEMLYLARKMNFRVREVPVDWEYEDGASGKSVIKNSLDGLTGMVGVRINAMKGRYK